MVVDKVNTCEHHQHQEHLFFEGFGYNSYKIGSDCKHVFNQKTLFGETFPRYLSTGIKPRSRKGTLYQIYIYIYIQGFTTRNDENWLENHLI